MMVAAVESTMSSGRCSCAARCLHCSRPLTKLGRRVMGSAGDFMEMERAEMERNEEFSSEPGGAPVWCAPC